MKKFQIIVPLFNETKNLSEFIKIIESHELPDDTFIFIDNGSTEKYKEFENKNYENKNKPWTVFRSNKNLGYGGAIIFGSKFVKSELISWMPGNLKLDPLEVYEILNIYSNIDDKTFLKSSRINRDFIDSVKTNLFGIIATLFFKINLLDSGAIPCMVNTKEFKKLPPKEDGFLFDLFVFYYFRCKKYKIIRPKVNYRTRLHGSSHWQKGLMSEIDLLLKALSRKKVWKKNLPFE